MRLPDVDTRKFLAMSRTLTFRNYAESENACPVTRCDFRVTNIHVTD
jgi:hypothetical protein